MSVISDFSFMDEIKIEDDLLNEEKILSHDSFWNGSGAELFDSDLTLDFLRNEEFLSSQTLENVSGSVCSDSGLSSDQQFSPVSFDEIEEEIDIKPNISYNQSVLDILCKDTCGERITLHKSEEDDDDSVDVCTIKTSTTKPVVRVKPSLSRSSVKVVNVSSLQNNPRSLLIPVKGKSGMKTIKIIKPCSKFQRRMSTTSNVSTRTICEPIDELKSSSDEGSDEADHQQQSSRYPRVQLTEEEKRLMVKEGISIPTHYPLTKQEERDLKRIRRKIRNKISAQDSRKRKKEYVDGLEDRVKQCSVENASLIKRVKALQNENQSLSTQLKRLQALIVPTSSNNSIGTGTSTGSSHPTATNNSSSSSNSPAQPATCLIVLVLSLALIMAPDLRGSRSSVHNSTSGDLVLPQHKSNSIIHSGVRSRNLLSVPDKSSRDVDDRKLMLEDDKKVLLEILDLEGGAERDHDYTYRSPPNQRKRSRSFIDPPLDEVWPPPKTEVFDYKRIRFDQRPTTPELEHIFEIEVSSEA